MRPRQTPLSRRGIVNASFLLALISSALAGPINDLASPSPQIRSCAAEAIRTHHLYQATSREKWDKVVSGLTTGETGAKLSAFIQRNRLGSNPSFDQNAIYHFRLDDSWVLLCAVNRTAKDEPFALTEFKIVEQPREIFVDPPPGYTGTWHTYRINGEIFGPEYCDHGKSEVLF